MTRRDITLIAVLSLIWGASFMLIKVAGRAFDPFALALALVLVRLALACAVLVPLAFVKVGRGALTHSIDAWRALVLLGLVNTAAPFVLISWAETRIDSSLAAILQAAAPIFGAVIGIRFGHDRVAGRRLLGVFVGFAGVALLVGAPGKGGIVAALAVVLAALGYACGASFGSYLTGGFDPLVVGAASTVAATVMVAPIGLWRLPTAAPGWKEWVSVGVLGLVGTGLAYVFLFALLRSAGPSRSILITYLIPGIALLYGVLLLGEPLRLAAVGGLVLILLGVALASGMRRVSGGRTRRPSTE